MMNNKSTKLTPAQEKAWRRLEKALAACSKENLYIWDDYGIISAVNGNNVSNIAPGLDGDVLNRDSIDIIFADCWKGSSSDDDLVVKWRSG